MDDYTELSRISQKAVIALAQDHKEDGYAYLKELFDKAVLATALRMQGGNQTQAARQLGIPRLTLINKCKKLGIPIGHSPHL